MGRRSVDVSEGSTSSSRKSHLSPTRISRVQEKEELQNLNDRLAAYIDTVRNLEAENGRLNSYFQTVQKTTEHEITKVKSLYGKELTDVRNILDVTAKEKAKLQLSVNTLKTELEEIRSKLLKKEKEFTNVQRQAKTSDALNQNLQKRISHLNSENRRLENQLEDAFSENKNISDQLASVKKCLDNETLAKVDLENKLQSAKEEITFKESVYKQDIFETRQVKETEILELKAQCSQKYEQKLSNSLVELREQYEVQLRMNRDEIETLYETKIADLQKRLDHTAHSSSSVRNELHTLKSKVDTLNSKNTNLETTNISLLSRIQDLEKMLEQERQWHKEALDLKDQELISLRNEMKQQLSEYRDLLGIKVALDMEISAYRKLLEGEEIRLNISPSSSRACSPQPLRSTPVRVPKRKRTIAVSDISRIESSDIEVLEHDKSGKFVKIQYRGKKELPIGGWKIIQKADVTEVTYKFPRNTIIKANTTITIWSFTSGIQTTGPENLVMKNQSWCSSTPLFTQVLNTDGEEVASFRST